MTEPSATTERMEAMPATGASHDRPAPWLSVLMPVYNGAPTLAASLRSIATQSEGVEVILVDQASSDESLAIAQGFADRLDLRIVSAPANRNWVQNTNQALSLARAPASTILHQDDLWLPNRAVLLREMRARFPDATLWLHAANYVDEAGHRIGRIAPPFGRRARYVDTTEALGHLLVQNTVSLPAAMFPTASARNIGGLDETLWYTADWDFWLKLARQGPIAWSPRIAAGFRLHEQSQTVTRSRDAQDFAQQLDIPLRRHMEALPTVRRDRIRALAETSNALNLWLAAAFHENRPTLAPVLGRVWRLGPVGWLAILRDTRIVWRVLPRLRLLWRRPFRR